MARVFSGIQPSGELHLGNYLGAVRNWVALQDTHECFFCIVDLHAITQSYEPENLAARTVEMATGLLAAGLDPERSTIFVQSHVPEHAELAWIFTTVTPIGELYRMTQFKDKAERQESVLTGLLSYPVLQAADILLYRAEQVPVGEDQIQHIELTREIARKWNARFGEYLPEAQALLTAVPRILGLDGNAKMSKSLDNTVGLLDPPDTVWQKLRPAVTDPARVTKKDPGTPEKCNLYTLHKAFSSHDTVQDVAEKCRTAGWGCLDCKKVLSESICRATDPIRDRAAALMADPDAISATLHEGAIKARDVARETLREVQARMGFYEPGAAHAHPRP